MGMCTVQCSPRLDQVLCRLGVPLSKLMPYLYILIRGLGIVIFCVWCVALVPYALPCDWSQLHPSNQCCCRVVLCAWLQKFVNELVPHTEARVLLWAYDALKEWWLLLYMWHVISKSPFQSPSALQAETCKASVMSVNAEANVPSADWLMSIFINELALPKYVHSQQDQCMQQCRRIMKDTLQQNVLYSPCYKLLLAFDMNRGGLLFSHKHATSHFKSWKRFNRMEAITQPFLMNGMYRSQYCFEWTELWYGMLVRFLCYGMPSCASWLSSSSIYYSLASNVCKPDTSGGRLKVPFAVTHHIYYQISWGRSQKCQNSNFMHVCTL